MGFCLVSEKILGNAIVCYKKEGHEGPHRMRMKSETGKVISIVWDEKPVGMKKGSPSPFHNAEPETSESVSIV